MIFIFLIIAAVIIAAAPFVIIFNGFYIVRQAEVIIIERLGRYSRTLLPGVHFVIPFLERGRSYEWTYLYNRNDGRHYQRGMQKGVRIDLRESVYDFPKQNVITKDNVTMEINALLYYQIFDPKAAVYEVLNLPEAIEKLTQTTLRNVIGSMDLDETLVSRDAVNERLRVILDEATDKWGVKVNRVELQEVNPPLDIREAMEKQMRAERSRRAAILESEGLKASAILEAEGEQQSQILRAQGAAQARVINAQGEAEARIKTALAEAEAIELLRKVSPNADVVGYLIATQYIKALPELTRGKNDKLVVIPYEATSLMGSLSSIKELFNHTASKT
jgi:regulator of protease activity HflC (stomatin/prohibitin superfamily)